MHCFIAAELMLLVMVHHRALRLLRLQNNVGSTQLNSQSDFSAAEAKPEDHKTAWVVLSDGAWVCVSLSEKEVCFAPD